MSIAIFSATSLKHFYCLAWLHTRKKYIFNIKFLSKIEAVSKVIVISNCHILSLGICKTVQKEHSRCELLQVSDKRHVGVFYFDFEFQFKFN